jgi:hypothetical protein
MQRESSKNIGPTSGAGATCEPSRPEAESTAIAGAECQKDHSSPMLSETPHATNGESMLSAEGSPVRTLATPEPAKGLMEAAADCGPITSESFAFCNLDSSSWRTSQFCLNGDLSEFSGTWPEAGLMQHGKCYRRAPSVPHTHDAECSLWPTPTASMDGRGFGIPLHNRTGRYKQSTVRRVQELVGKHGWRIHPNFTEALMGYPLDHTAIEPSEMPSCPKLQNGSDTAS